MRIFVLQIVILFIFVYSPCAAQTVDSPGGNIPDISAKFLDKIEIKYASIEKNLTSKTDRYLRKLQRQEKKLRNQAGDINENSLDSVYSAFRSQLPAAGGNTGKINLNQYNSYIDTLSTSLDFLQNYKGLAEKIKLPAGALNKLKDKLNQTEKVKGFIAQRRQQMKEILSQYTKVPAPLKKQYARLNKTAFYYSAQVKEYKDMLKEPQKIEEKTMALLSQMPLFQKFMKENSQLASLFRLPGSSATGGRSQASPLAGLQTRASVQGMIQERIAAGGPNAMAQVQQNLAAAHAEIDKLKDKMNHLGGGSSDVDMPDFKPNSQRTKSFLKRLEYSADVRFGKGNGLLPSTANIGLGVGYKLNDKSAAGVGISYSLGMGTIQHISFTSQGIGLRSYIDKQIKKQFYVSGGYEMNYNSAFKNIQQLKDYDAWQRSALIGISKKYRISRKVKGEMKLLYDFMANTHVPVSQPVVFRLGYKF